ncbi:MAG: thioesterase, partial [Rikenellaceae bacterium]
MELLGRYGFSIMMSQVDNKGRCRLSAMGDILIHCACIHAQDVGFGVDKLHSTNVSWVLTALSVKMDKMPHFLDDIFVETWMEKRIHSIVFRHFIVYDKDNNVIGGGTSYWTVIDMAKRAVTDFAKLDLESSARAGVSPIGRPKRVRPCNDIFICQKEV